MRGGAGRGRVCRVLDPDVPAGAHGSGCFGLRLELPAMSFSMMDDDANNGLASEVCELSTSKGVAVG